MKIQSTLPQPKATRTPAPPPEPSPQPEEIRDAFFARDAALVVGGLGILAAPALAGATLGLGGVAAAAAGGALLDAFGPEDKSDPNASKLSGTISLAALAGTGLVLGVPGVLVTAGVLGTCGLLLSWADLH